MKPVGSGRKKGVGSTVKRIPNDKLEAVEQIISGNADNCYIRNKIGCHCTTECGYKKSMEEI